MTLMHADTPTQSGAPGRAVILLRESDRSPTARRRFRQTAARLQERLRDTPVAAAYVTPGAAGGDWSLGAAVERLLSAGAREIAVVPYVVEWSYPEAYDLPDALYDLAEAFPHVTFRLARPLGAGDAIASLLQDQLTEAWDLPALGPGADRLTVRQVAEVAGQSPVTTAVAAPGEVTKLPAHKRHVFLCFGRRCMEQGSPEAYRALTALLAERGLDAGPDRVKVSRSKCLSPCQAAPIACVYPVGDFFCRLDAAMMPAFVDQALAGASATSGQPGLPGHTIALVEGKEGSE